jgi:hypothetical protein
VVKEQTCVQPQTREWIIDGVEKAFIWAGASDFDSGMNQFKKVVDRMQNAHDTMRSRDHLALVLDEIPEPTWLQRRFIQGIFRYLPHLFRYGVKQIVENAEESLPELPRGRPGLDAYTKAQIVAEISKKELRGCTHKQAKMRTATQFNVSFATVQRAWDDRANRGEVDFRSVLMYLPAEMEDPVVPGTN